MLFFQINIFYERYYELNKIFAILQRILTPALRLILIEFTHFAVIKLIYHYPFVNAYHIIDLEIKQTLHGI